MLTDDLTTTVIKLVDARVSEVVDEIWTLRRVELAPLAAHGKRLRAQVALASARASGEALAVGRLVDGAAAVELVHLGTLLHDDIMDAGTTRRGSPATWAKFGMGRAIVAADALYAAAFCLSTGVDPAGAQILSRSFIDVCDGQTAELDDVGDPNRSVDRTEALAAQKSGGLFGAAAAIGALSSGAQDIDAAIIAGVRLGLAYQLLDDLHDVDIDAGAVGRDLASGLLTVPWIIALRATPDRLGIRDQVRAGAGVAVSPAMLDWLWRTDGPRVACARIIELLTSLDTPRWRYLWPLAARLSAEAHAVLIRNTRG